MAEIRWLNETEDRAWRGLRRVYLLALAEISRDLQKESGLSDADYDVLTGLSESPGDRCRSGDLAKQIRWSTSRLSHQVDRMQRRGLVDRLPRTDDARGADIVLTPEGRRVIEVAAPLHVESVRRHLFDHLSEEQVAQLAAISHKLVDHHDAD